MGAQQSGVYITNKSDRYTLRNPCLYLVSGRCQIPLPTKLGPSESGNTLFSGVTGRGSVGVFTYDLYDPTTDGADKKIAVMFSVPLDHRLFSNWCAVGVFDKNTNCDNALYRKMYYHNERGFVRGKADGHDLTQTFGDVTVEHSMTTFSVATHIYVYAAANS
uniref:Uncharacterized protein n=1 Tax=Pundamilia nyererei TaxID=303518 RepID=A0A3B4H6S0_9CICH